MQEVVIVCGPPASGKSTYSQNLIKQDYIYLNRDTEGGKILSLIPKLENTLETGSSVVLDNLFPTIEVRKPFIDVCKKMNVPIRCVIIDTSIEDAQINALHRMWKKHKKIFFDAKDLKGVNDPNMFPVVVLFKYRKEYQKPTLAEGFAKVDVVKFKREPSVYKNKALILDYDGNLRDNKVKVEGRDYPIHPSEIKILPGRKEKIQEYVDQGYLLLGVSNQSGVHKGILTYEDAVACFEKTNELLGHKIDYYFCPHQSNPPNCYCRKPQSAAAVMFIERYKLDPSQCIFVGDMTSDKTFAERVGFKYYHTDEFFK